MQKQPSLTVGIGEAARLLGIGKSSMYKLVKSGKAKTVTIAGRKLLTRDELERIAREGTE